MSDQADNSGLLSWNEQIIAEFRANDGRVGGRFEGAPLLLLHTTGAKTGLDRVSPMMYLEFEGRIFVFASFAGADVHPAWFRNLEANPGVTYELGTTSHAAHASAVPDEERDRIYAVQAERHPGFAEYETMTDRTIPVVELVADDR